ILQEITTLPIVLTLEIETDLETGTITNPIIIIDPEVEANLAI
ncbi:1976_t:CDS:1, partial [Cetraspora pellucida]